MPETNFNLLNTKLDEIASNLTGAALRQITDSVAYETKKLVESELEGDIGADRKFSGWKRVKLGVGYEVTSDYEATISPRPNGPWKVLDRGRRSGAAIPARGRGNKTLMTPYGPKTYSRTKPLVIGGTRGKRTWINSVDEIKRRIPDIALQEFTNRLRKVIQ